MSSEAFDRRLADALHAYAKDAPTIRDAAGYASAIAREHPRRAGWSSALARPTTRRLVLLGVAVALILASLLVLAGIGAFRQAPSFPMPDELFGDYQATVDAARGRVPAGDYTLDLTDENLLHGPDGRPLDWAGRARAVVPGPTGGIQLAIAGTWQCGDAEYAIRVGGDTPGAAAGPSASGGNPTPDPAVGPLQSVLSGEPFRLAPVSESCDDRLQVLTSGPWDRPQIELKDGDAHDSLDFTEPFDFVLGESPAEVGIFLRTVRRGVLTIGNGWDYRGMFSDDVEVGADLCRPDAGTLADIPATPQAVEVWLRSSPDLRVGSAVPIQVDGRAGLAIPVNADDCLGSQQPLSNEVMLLGQRIYAIPTGDDLILFGVASYGMPDLDRVADELVRSIEFR
jgi:hypothetical protein